jgi:hypothetical protein
VKTVPFFAIKLRKWANRLSVQACLGNIPAAETHLNGVMALFDSREDADSVWDSRDDVKSELADRYLIL